MTAEVLAANISGIAMAADSAATRGSKVSKSAHKIHRITRNSKLAVMVFEQANYLGVPWETWIANYREGRGQSKVASADDLLTDFILFLNQETQSCIDAKSSGKEFIFRNRVNFCKAVVEFGANSWHETSQFYQAFETYQKDDEAVGNLRDSNGKINIEVAFLEFLTASILRVNINQEQIDDNHRTSSALEKLISDTDDKFRCKHTKLNGDFGPSQRTQTSHDKKVAELKAIVEWFKAESDELEPWIKAFSATALALYETYLVDSVGYTGENFDGKVNSLRETMGSTQKNRDLIKKLATHIQVLKSKNWQQAPYSGIVIAGYGENDTSPHVFTLHLSAYPSARMGMLRFERTTVTQENTPLLLGFAKKRGFHLIQNGIAEQFASEIQEVGRIIATKALLDGISIGTNASFDTEHLEVKSDISPKAFAEEIVDSDHLAPEFDRNVNELLVKFDDGIRMISRGLSSRLYKSIDHLTPKELGELVKLMVEIDCLSSLALDVLPYVAGPVDTAVITKRDGVKITGKA